jgi:prefoldin alpha subunit
LLSDIDREENADPKSHRIMCAFADKKVLIPLTSSLYVPGKIKDTENVIVDIGTGYFVEKVSRQSID